MLLSTMESLGWKGYRAGCVRLKGREMGLAEERIDSASLAAHEDLFAAKVKQIVYMDLGYNFGCGDSKGSGWSPWLGSTQDCDGAAQFVASHAGADGGGNVGGDGGAFAVGGLTKVQAHS